MLKQFQVLVVRAHAGRPSPRLEDALHRLRSGISATVFHEGMSILERDRAAAYFADEEFGAQVLICSRKSAARPQLPVRPPSGAVRPAGPDLLEQRIGRLDRIDPATHHPAARTPGEQRPAAPVPVVPPGAERLPQYLPPATPCNTSSARACCRCSTAARTRPGTRCSPKAAPVSEALEAELHSSRDRLLELNSGGAGEGEALVEAIEEQDDDFACRVYMERLFDAYGIHSEDHSENALILKPSEKMLDAGFPLGDDEGVTITYDRAQALAREDMQFLTWEHPMVQGGMDLVLSGSMGNTSASADQEQGAEARHRAARTPVRQRGRGTARPPARPLATAAGPALPARRQRGNDLAGRVSLETLNDQLESVPRVSANKFVQAQRDVLAKQFDVAEGKIVPRHEERVARAKQQFAAAMDEELARLTALKAVNPSVRDSSWATTAPQREEGLALLDKASLRLEAIRILVAG